MSIPLPCTTTARFNDDDIEQQLERIFLHSDFSSSEILRKFLSFVVHETLMGNANCLKEYTIALNVLQKPVNFNPQKNCIVRIHAGRLRRALSHYYSDTCSNDEIIIGVPKGKYVPVFMDRQQWLDERRINQTPPGGINMLTGNDPVTFAILPFNESAEDEIVRSFRDNLCLQLGSALAQVKQISVVSYQAVKSMAANNSDLKALSSLLRFNYIISVGAQYLKHRIRVNTQIIDCRFYRQVWSKIFDCKVTNSNLFEIQDGICQVITDEAGLVAVL